MVQCYTIIALERLCCYIIYYMRTGEAVLVRKSIKGPLVRLLVEYSTIGALGRLCWYSRLL